MKIALLIFTVLLFSQSSFAQSITGTWLNPKATTKIDITEKSAGHYEGKLVWADSSRPDLKEYYGFAMLDNLKKTGTNTYEGKIHDPRKNKTYSCIITLNGQTMDMRGYVGLSIFGKTQIWKRVE